MHGHREEQGRRRLKDRESGGGRGSKVGAMMALRNLMDGMRDEIKDVGVNGGIYRIEKW